MQLTEKYISDALRIANNSKRITFKPKQVSRKYQYRCAAVLIPLFVWNKKWNVLFTHRTELVESHKGQVSFPGGACEENETNPEQTALREAEEEIGLLFQDVRVLGKMKEVVTVTGYRITPVVGVIPWPYQFQPAPVEVVRVFSVPFDWISNHENWDEKLYITESESKGFPVIEYHDYDGEVIWGVTAQIMHNFLSVLGILK